MIVKMVTVIRETDVSAVNAIKEGRGVLVARLWVTMGNR